MNLHFFVADESRRRWLRKPLRVFLCLITCSIDLYLKASDKVDGARPFSSAGLNIFEIKGYSGRQRPANSVQTLTKQLASEQHGESETKQGSFLKLIGLLHHIENKNKT